MKNKTLSLVVIALLVIVGAGIVISLALALGAGSLFVITTSSGQQPTPVEAYEPATSYQPITVDQVEVEVGVGSPIPVEVVASGTWPDLCAQIAEVHSKMNGFQIDVTVLTSTAESCPPDHLGLPFRFALPLNIVEMPEGTYTVSVNGVSTTFDWPIALDESTGSISGWVWHDKCDSGQDGQPAPANTPPGCIMENSPLGMYHANALLDADELSIESVVVKLREGDCSSTSLTETLAETLTLASDISYSFTGLKAGTYCVSIDPQQEPNFTILRPGLWTFPYVTEGITATTVTLQPGENKFDVNFGWDHQFK